MPEGSELKPVLDLRPGRGRIPTALCFDTEDLIAPEEDDAALWLAEILHEHGLTGSFMLVGEKVRLLGRRGRQDVIEALKRHQLSFHSTWHSVHPTTTEICLDRNFQQGMDALWEWDRQGWADTERILGRPLLGWACTGSSWSPSVMGLVGRMGRAYAYSPVRLPGHNVCWYAGCLGFYGEGVGGFDTTFVDDALFEKKLAETKRRVEEYEASGRRGADWLCFFMCHPTRVIHSEFWDAVNFAFGANPPREQWKPAPRHDNALIPTMQKNYRRLCEYLQSNSELEIMGLGTLANRYDGQEPAASAAAVREMARRVAEERQVLFTDLFTAAEIALFFCSALTAPAEHYSRRAAYGPLSMPPVQPAEGMAADGVKAAAQRVLDAAGATGYLPASVEIGSRTVGIGSFFVAASEAVLGQERVSGPAEAPYPVAADEIARHAAEIIRNWLIHPRDMNLDNLLEQTRLQCWTIKPAWPRTG
jgi:hypothetical protein